ncbi:MAG: hypothetical protein KDA77_07190 [Planctomycetaceae bacterium]|nr:hypothetical protein [Planctomycetaceae bacterium]
MKALTLKALAVAAALGLSPLLLSAQVQADTPDAQLNSGSSITATILPAPADAQMQEIVRAGTAHLNLDDATRARYRYHNGRWWFLTEQGQWLVDHNGTWKPFDPTMHGNSGQYISSQNANSEASQADSGGNDCYCTYTSRGYAGSGSYSHRSHRHEFGGIHYGHWGTEFRDGSK